VLDPVAKVQKILTVYKQRSERLLHIMAQSEFDEGAFLTALRLQRTAFHNFVGIEHSLAKKGINVATHRELRDLGKAAALVSAQVEEALAVLHAETGQLLHALSRARRSLRPYHSGNPQNHRFLKGA